MLLQVSFIFKNWLFDRKQGKKLRKKHFWFVYLFFTFTERAAGLKGARAFRAAARSVLSPANREFIADQARKAGQRAHERHRKKLVIGGKTFSIDEDDRSVMDEDSTQPGSTKNWFVACFFTSERSEIPYLYI